MIIWPEISEWPTPIGSGRHYGAPIGIDGRLMPAPSVTTVLSATADTRALDRWRARASRRELEDADAKRVLHGADGTWLHSVIEACLLSGVIPDLDGQTDRRRALWESVDALVTSIHFDEIYAEKAIFHPSGYAGRFDCLYRVGDLWFLADWKNAGKELHPSKVNEYSTQLGAYAQGIEHVAGIMVSRAYCVVAIPGEEAHCHAMDREALERAIVRFGERVERYHDLEAI